jgi:hypothetical protein
LADNEYLADNKYSADNEYLHKKENVAKICGEEIGVSGAAVASFR